ncbi:MAG: hypothetical protein K8J08_22990 [Thermoanaerobaculia bacterium]|nr:hypothetical protein [Thermoanaerobaculia bacterium]
MIRPLRRVHRAAIPLLGTIVLGGMILALTSRSEVPLQEERVSRNVTLSDPALPSAGPWQLLSTVDGVDVQFRTHEAGGWIEIHAETWVPRPDLLVYASAVAPEANSAENLPPGSRFLGAFSGLGSAVYETELSERWLVLYSGGHREILAVTSLGPAPPLKTAT